MDRARDEQPLVVPVRNAEADLGPWMLLVILGVLLLLVGFFFLPTGKSAGAQRPDATNSAPASTQDPPPAPGR